MPSNAVPRVLADARRSRPDLALDGWAPSVQGAVGHVVGVHDDAGMRYVLKIHAGDAALAAAEAAAQDLAADGLDVAVPRTVLRGTVTGEPVVGYLLMTRLPGVRWADRRDLLAGQELADLARAVGIELRRLHTVRGERFGPLLPNGRGPADVVEMMTGRAQRLLADYAASGGPAEYAERAGRVISSRLPAFAGCEPVLCHNDFIDSNLLLPPTGAPVLTGAVDWERASWDDPLSDLALTRSHIRFHNPEHMELLTEAYGIESDAERARLDVHELLNTLHQRAWIASDRPPGWPASLARLDGLIDAWT